MFAFLLKKDRQMFIKFFKKIKLKIICKIESFWL